MPRWVPFAAILWSLVWGSPALAQGLGAFVSPGQLAQDHADLEGLTQCGSCHSAGQGVDPVRCLACHDTVKAQVDAKKGFHGKLGAECASCHPDHKGRTAPLVKLSESTFDHTPTGFPLGGAHAATACVSCHTTAGVWTGLDPTCRSCHLHEEPHGLAASTRTLLGSCGECHTDLNWDALPLPATVFDHQSATDADFALLGAHATVKCRSCHPDTRFVPIAHDRCVDCHTSPHLAKLSAVCTDCHDLDDWKVATFDHDLARFHLAGRHTTVACAECHGRTLVKAIPHDACARCHDDPHGGQFAPRACDACHTVEVAGFRIPTFDHAKTAFPLHGEHQDVACASCHGEGREATWVGLAHDDCAACHEDPHVGRFAPTPCANCHSEAGWRVEDFDHGRTAFPLTGGHVGLDCESCHVDHDWHPPHASCNDCHADRSPHADRDPASCEGCHVTAAWATVGFDHAAGTSFPLAGAHADAACAACHTTTDRFDGLDTGCPACHAAERPPVHYPGACDTCHVETDWVDVLVDAFDHDRTGFALRSTHATLPCAACHPTAPPWGLAASGCEDCHAADDPHLNLVGPACDACHTPTSWNRSQWRHTWTGFPLRGAHRLAACPDCHATSYPGTPTECWRCHEAQAPLSVAAHQSPLFPTCDTCHNPFVWDVTNFPH